RGRCGRAPYGRRQDTHRGRRRRLRATADRAIPCRRARPSRRGTRLLHEPAFRARAGQARPRTTDGVPDETDRAIVSPADSPALRARRVDRWAAALAAVVLAVQNGIVFLSHYLRGAGFPWDFGMSYYAMVAFWTTAVGQGTIPQWIPFQQMGYPFALQ